MYQKQRYDASAGFMSLLINWSIDKMKIPMSNHYFDMFLPTELLLTKSSDWDYEREWRLFKILDSGNIVKQKMIANLKPTAVYVCVRIKEQNVMISRFHVIKCCRNILHQHMRVRCFK